jgi:Fe-Mn family superoxide dismutase
MVVTLTVDARRTSRIPEPIMAYTLPDLPYPLTALAPSIDAETLALHHDKHHRGYVDNLNATLRDHPRYGQLSIESLLTQLGTVDAGVRNAVRNYGGGQENHSLLWKTLAPGGRAASPALQQLVSQSFHSMDGLKAALSSAAENLFGSGWVFLTWRGSDSPLEVLGLPNQDSPWSLGVTPLLALDLWEHAYYLQYHNLRPKWLQAWWDIIDWAAVETNWRQAVAHESS